MSLPLQQKLIVPGLLLAIVIPAAIGYITYQQGMENTAAAGWVGHTYEVRAKVQVIYTQLAEITSSTRGFLINGQEEFLGPYTVAARDIGGRLQELRKLTADNAEQQKRVSALEALVARRLTYSQALLDIRRKQGYQAAARITARGEGLQIMAEVRELAAAMDTAEQILLQRRITELRENNRRTQLLFLGLAGSLAAVLLAAVWLAYRNAVVQQRVLDLTEQARAHSENIVNTVRTPLVVLDSDLRVQSANRAYYRTFLVSAAEVEGRAFHELGSGQWDIPGLRHRLEEILAQHTTLEDFEVERDFPGLGQRIMLLHASKIFRVGNNTETVLVAIEDITARKRAEATLTNLSRDLQRQNTELQAVNQELEAFTYTVSHDLRAPLRHIHGFSHILTEEYGPRLDAEARRYLARVEEGADRMGQLLDDLLNLSRVGRKELTLQVTGLNSLVEEVRTELQPETAGRQIDWRVETLPFVECDPALMKQVLANLLGNAVKYTHPRERALIEVGHLRQNGQSVIFVRDNGVGFSMKYADKLFGVFQRLHRQEDFKGTGVGLATVQRIIHKHGGRVWAESELDQGATFFFTSCNPAAPLETIEHANGGHR
ncbi:MAG: CHASE3 domain-containing protein [Acidobacteriales bacterium]|nr:CHASE3 domain-containing protein [Terriglobales bacterium]